MTGVDLMALCPLILIAAFAIAIMLVIAFYRNHLLTATLTAAGILLAFLTVLVISLPLAPRQITPLLVLDHYALFYMGLIFAASLALAILSYPYLRGRQGNYEEYYLLLLLATLGSATLVGSTHFASFFLGLEILSVSLYALIAYPRAPERSIEAGVKYLILAAASAAFLLFGMALIYAELGTMEFSQIANRATQGGPGILLLTGLGMIIVGLGFKLGFVPFHMWTPDVYEGAPAPVTAFVATISKGSVFALLLRYFSRVELHTLGSVFLIFTILAIASMFVGNLLALLQRNVKRILAYSSIAHLGYLLVAFLASGILAPVAVAFYLVAYFITTLGAFGVVTVLSGKERDADDLEDYRSLVRDRPYLAGIFTAMLLSLAGIPLTAGFVGKFYIVVAGAGSALWLLVLCLVGASAIGLFYYLRIVGALYASLPKEKENHPTQASLSLAGGLVLAVLLILLVWLGVYPAPLVHLIQGIFSKPI
jgi:NADH-quinone oxidoreductase subunit N